MYILIYVDDIILTDNDSTMIQTLLQHLSLQFSIKDHGTLNYFLSIEVNTTSKDLHLTQTRYLHTILEKASMTIARPCATPLQLGVQLSKLDGSPM
jgi:GR25 family glycosyltransferase involved in LPS biosynthesis